MKFIELFLLAQLSAAWSFVTPSSYTNTNKHVPPSLLNLVDPLQIHDLVSSSISITDAALTSTLVDPLQIHDFVSSSISIADAALTSTYSKASYYTVLGLFVMSAPGIWSQVKRSTSAKIKRKTFISPGENANEGKNLRQQAGEIMAYMKANNYEVVNAGETITFRGLVKRSTSQLLFLVTCTAFGMGSLALVLDIVFKGFTIPFIGAINWYFLVLLSPLAGAYYWSAGDRVDDCEVKLATNDDETENEITIQGNDDELERMWRTLGWLEKGMIKVEGVLD